MWLPIEIKVYRLFLSVRADNFVSEVQQFNYNPYLTQISKKFINKNFHRLNDVIEWQL